MGKAITDLLRKSVIDLEQVGISPLTKTKIDPLVPGPIPEPEPVSDLMKGSEDMEEVIRAYKEL